MICEFQRHVTAEYAFMLAMYEGEGHCGVRLFAHAVRVPERKVPGSCAFELKMHEFQRKVTAEYAFKLMLCEC